MKTELRLRKVNQEIQVALRQNNFKCPIAKAKFIASLSAHERLNYKYLLEMREVLEKKLEKERGV